MSAKPDEKESWVSEILVKAHVSPDELRAFAGRTPVFVNTLLPPLDLKAKCPFASRTRVVLDETPDLELEEIVRSEGIEVEHANGCFQVAHAGQHLTVGRSRLVDLALLAVLSIALHT